LAHVLADAGRRVLCVFTDHDGRPPARRKRQRYETIVAAAGQPLPLADGALAGPVVVDPPAQDDLPDHRRVVRTGGRPALIAAVPPEDASRRVLCVGLTDVEQRAAGRTTVTSGRVWRARAAAATSSPTPP